MSFSTTRVEEEWSQRWPASNIDPVYVGPRVTLDTNLHIWQPLEGFPQYTIATYRR